MRRRKRSPTTNEELIKTLLAGNAPGEILKYAVLMQRELKSNEWKNAQEHWTMTDARVHVGQLYYHVGKLHHALLSDEAQDVVEYAADVGNVAMMVLDALALLDSGVKHSEKDWFERVHETPMLLKESSQRREEERTKMLKRTKKDNAAPPYSGY